MQSIVGSLLCIAFYNLFVGVHIKMYMYMTVIYTCTCPGLLRLV